jgi:hypothetical protein
VRRRVAVVALAACTACSAGDSPAPSREPPPIELTHEWVLKPAAATAAGNTAAAADATFSKGMLGTRPPALADGWMAIAPAMVVRAQAQCGLAPGPDAPIAVLMFTLTGGRIGDVTVDVGRAQAPGTAHPGDDPGDPRAACVAELLAAAPELATQPDASVVIRLER